MNLSKYMDWAINIAQKSEDPNTKVGACIVDKNGNIIGQGYNEFPNGCEDQFPWDREGNSSLDTKYPYICHAELNAILEAMSKSGGKLNNCTIFVTLFPCNECAKLIVQSGIEKVVYLSDKYYYTENVIASKRIFNKALIPTYSIEENVSKILNIESIVKAFDNLKKPYDAERIDIDENYSIFVMVDNTFEDEEYFIEYNKNIDGCLEPCADYNCSSPFGNRELLIKTIQEYYWNQQKF